MPKRTVMSLVYFSWPANARANGNASLQKRRQQERLEHIERYNLVVDMVVTVTKISGNRVIETISADGYVWVQGLNIKFNAPRVFPVQEE